MTATAPLDAYKSEADAHFRTKRLISFGVPGLVLVYLIYIFFAFDVPGLMGRASADNAATLLSDTYSYKVHVTRDNRNAEVSVAIEGEKNRVRVYS